jgi:hypothetical protein
MCFYHEEKTFREQQLYHSRLACGGKGEEPTGQ